MRGQGSPSFKRVSMFQLAEPGHSRFERRKPQDPITQHAEASAFEAGWRPPAWFERITVVLVEPTDAVNIGGVVRVMANTGFLRLRLVNPIAFDAWDGGGVA